MGIKKMPIFRMGITLIAQPPKMGSTFERLGGIRPPKTYLSTLPLCPGVYLDTGYTHLSHMWFIKLPTTQPPHVELFFSDLFLTELGFSND